MSLNKINSKLTVLPFDKAEAELTEKTAATAFQLAWGVISKIGKKAWDQATLERAMQRYAQGYLSRHGSVKVLGMPKPIPLASIYTAVNVISPDYRNAYSGIDEIRNSLRARKHNFFNNSTSTPGIIIANKEKFLNILGAPGAGKSTFLKRIGLEALLPRRISEPIQTCAFGVPTSQYVPECFPVFVELRRFKKEQVDVFQAIVNEFETCGLPESSAFVKLCLSHGRLLLLLDGVDELPIGVLDAAIQSISDFADQYKQNRFITSCRTAFYKTFFHRSVDVELTAFDDGQIKTFVNNWFSSELDHENKSAEAFHVLLFGSEHRSTLELARTPLLLTFLCLVYDDSQKFPANRSSLYRRALMILMEKWAAEKRVHNSPIYVDLHIELEMELLSEIAAKAYIEDQILFSGQYLIQKVVDFMRATLDAPQSLDSRKILEAIQVQQGLLVERAADTFSFSHLTIQEYLTAEYFHSPSRLKILVNNHMFDEKWREIFLLASGMSGADDLLLCMLGRAEEFIGEDPKLLSCVQWGMKIVPETEFALRDALLRLLMVSLPLRFKRRDYDGPSILGPIEKLFRNLDLDFSRSKFIPKRWGSKNAQRWLRFIGPSLRLDNSLNDVLTALEDLRPERPLAEMFPGSRFKFTKKVNKIVYDYFGLEESLQNISKASLCKFESLFYGYNLILDCKSSALRVSTSTWEIICKRLANVSVK